MIPAAPPCLEGYENIPRKWNPKFECYVAKVTPGEYYVTQSDEAIITTLGSCIACCIRDKVTGIGGLNHFMLPENKSADASGKQGDWAMEFLINSILINGGERHNLELKYFGGAQLLPGLQNIGIGQKNIEFIEQYIQRESLTVVGSDVGDRPPRTVLYFPKTGKVKLKKLPINNAQEVAGKEKKYAGKLITHNTHAGEVELF